MQEQNRWSCHAWSQALKHRSLVGREAYRLKSAPICLRLHVWAGLGTKLAAGFSRRGNERGSMLQETPWSAGKNVVRDQCPVALTISTESVVEANPTSPPVWVNCAMESDQCRWATWNSPPS
jgi:hypothetical protein